VDNPNDSKHDRAADDESDIEQYNGIEDLHCPDRQDVSAMPDLPGLVRPTRKSKRHAEKLFVMVNVVETRRNKEAMKKYDRICQWFTSFM